MALVQEKGSEMSTLGLPVPPGGPLDAAQVGYPYHLIIRGYDDDDESDLLVFVKKFLRILFGNNSQCPVKYGFHSIIPDPSHQSRKILRLSLTREEEASRGLNLEGALKMFAQRFFKVDHETCNKACSSLSEYGLYGFSPEEESMRLSWYEAMFFWMSSFRADRMSHLEQELAFMSKKNKLSSWFPTWTGAGLFALSLGATAILPGLNSKFPDGDKQFNVAPIDTLLVFLGTQKEKDAIEIEQTAKNTCEAFLQQSEKVIEGMREKPSTERPMIAIAKGMTIQLVNLFEKGFETVTACKQAVEIFVEIKQKGALASGAHFARLCFSAYNLSVITELAGDAEAALSSSVGLMAAGGVLFSLAQIAFSAANAIDAHKRQKKWTKVAVFVAASVRHAQYCEMYLRWVYNSQSSNGPQQGSPQFAAQLAHLLEQMDMKTPTPEECTDSAVRNRLQAFSNTLLRETNNIKQLL